MYVRSYYGNKYESTLAKLKVYLMKHFLECPDIRDVVKRDFLSIVRPPKLVPSKSPEVAKRKETDPSQNEKPKVLVAAVKVKPIKNKTK